jgi:hypothetical protein
MSSIDEYLRKRREIAQEPQSLNLTAATLAVERSTHRRRGFSFFIIPNSEAKMFQFSMFQFECPMATRQAIQKNFNNVRGETYERQMTERNVKMPQRVLDVHITWT